MALVITTSSSTAGNPPWLHLAGTIQQVLDELQNQNVSAGHVSYWSDDGTDAKAVLCRMR